MSMRKLTVAVITTTTALAVMVSILKFVHAATSAVTGMHCLAYLSTDKPIYRDGEKVYLRAVLLGADDHKPLADNQNAWGMLQVKGPKGEILFNSSAATEQSVAGMPWQVPADAAGGQYKAIISFPSSGYPPAERKFEVRAYRAPRLKGEIIFLRDGYGPGETVKASLHLDRAEGGVPAGAEVSATAIVDGKDAYTGKTTIDAAGNCAVEFPLPNQIDMPDGTLSLAITDGGVVEPISKTIPILVNSVEISLYPEGGDLIAGLENRVYLQSSLPSQKPADLVGSIFDSTGKQVATVRTEHEGRGRFSFTPMAGEHYALKISQPAGIAKTFPLPQVKPTGVIVRAEQDVFAKDQPVKLQVVSTTAGDFTISLGKHQTEVSSLTLTLQANQPQEISLTPPSQTDGVLIATVIDKAKSAPVAERLIFRDSGKSLHVSIKADKPSYCPADKATLTVTTTDDAGKPVPAVVGITVTDQSILRMIEKRDYAPRLNAMVMLEDDVRELADAEIYLDPTDPKAAIATDLLLGTQGWRRFATADAEKFIAAQGDTGRRALADLQPVVPQPEMFGVGGRGGGGVIRNRAVPAAAAAPRGQVNGAAQANAEKAADALQPKAEFALAATPAAALDKAKNMDMEEAQVDQLPKKMLSRRFGPTPIRIYAHDLAVSHRAAERSDFTETLYWCAGIKTDANGTATVSFTLNDSVTSFSASADAFTADGAIGQGETTLASVQPFYVEPKLPLEVTTGDVIRLPISIVNGTSDPMKTVTISTESGKGIEVSKLTAFSLPAGARQRQVLDVTIGSMPTASDFVIHAQAGVYHDDITRKLIAVPTGFPTEFSKGGLLAANASATQEIDVPDTLVAGSVVTTAMLYPTPMGNLTAALKRLMQEPNGCFEQTTSTNYPLVMADQYFLSHSGVRPRGHFSRTSDLLDKGLQPSDRI